MDVKSLGLLAAALIACPILANAQPTSYLLQFANDTVGSGAVTVNSANIVTGISNMSLDDLIVQTVNGPPCMYVCEPAIYGITSGVLSLSGDTLVLDGKIPELGINSKTALLTVQFSGPIAAQNIAGPGPNLFVGFPGTASLSFSQTLLSDLGIVGGITDASASGGIYATGSKRSYSGFDGETDVQFTRAPEIDPASAASGLTLLMGAFAVLRGRRRVNLS
jgi:hypothetical protein